MAVAVALGLTASLDAAGQSTKAAGQKASVQRAQSAPVAALPTDRLIVRFAARADARSDAKLQVQGVSQRLGVALTHLRTTATGAQVMRLPKRMPLADVEALAAQMAKDPAVSFVAPDRLLRRQWVPNDSEYPSQWHYYEAVGGINLPEALDLGFGENAVVAVVDTGVHPHADLAANLLPGYDMVSDPFISQDGDGRDSDASDPGDWMEANACGEGDPIGPVASSWHGTHVAGTIAAVTNNAIGVAGVAPAARVVPVRALGKCGGYTSDILDGVIWAAGGDVAGAPANAYPAQVINLSLGGYGPCDANSQQLFDQVRSLGVTVVAAAGNDATDASQFFPANCQNVLPVAATDRAGARAAYSNSGLNVALAGPGGDTGTALFDGVLSTINTGEREPASDGYIFYAGTSMAAAHVSGVAALLKSSQPALTPAQVDERLTATARPFPGFCAGCGSGIVDARAALTGEVPPSAEVIELENGVPQSGLAGGAGSARHFTLQVPENSRNLRFVLSGADGDADLYVRRGSRPTPQAFDCRPFASDSNESCAFENPEAGTWHVLVHAFAAYSGTELVASYEQAETGYTQAALSSGPFSWQRYEVDVAPGSERLLVTIGGGRGTADLYLRHERSPTLFQFNCASRTSSIDESCTIEAPPAGKWQIGIFSWFGYRDLTLQVRVLP